MPFFNDQEGSKIPAGLPSVIDAHIHIFPQTIFSSIRRWFAKHAWRIRYQMSSSRIFQFLLSRGITHIIALQYAHKPGIARNLNRYMLEKSEEFDGNVTGLATVFPGENDAEGILQEAFDAGLKGLKLHAHVQCFDMNDDTMIPIYHCCQSNHKPILMHIGREPKSEAYNCDPYQLCSAEKLKPILIDFPKLKICVPHLGLDEISAYRKMIEKYDNLWLDTTMALAGYFPFEPKIVLGNYRSDRVMYGSDFPNIPYEWDRELKALLTFNLSDEALQNITFRSAVNFFDLSF